ncbi:MAG: preprotein translocase subunit SecE [Dehalococcoidia bacterium]
MGREQRRAQQRAERRQQRGRGAQPQRSAPQMSTGGGGGEAPRKGSFLRPRWAMDIISELRKVTWPGRREVANLTFVVLVVSLLLGMVLGAADLVFGWLIEQTLLG